MNVLFHADERLQSGRGHRMRCHALAAAFRARGHGVEFVAADAIDSYPQAALLIVDTYAATADDFVRWSAIAPLCVIDDLGDRDLSSAAAVLNQNFGASARAYPAGSLLLLGPRYALLDEQFRDLRRARTFRPEDRRVLVTLGGGNVAPLIDTLREALQNAARNLEILTLEGCSRREVAERMSGAHLAVTGGGITLLELSVVGTPCIVTTLASNQEPGAAAMAAKNLAILAGPLERGLPLIALAVPRLLSDARERERLSRGAMEAVDGCGAQRAAEALETILRT